MFVLFSLPANEAGETPLDIARRLKHLQCEELVSLLCLDLAYAYKHITQELSLICVCLYVCEFVRVYS